MEKLWKNRNQLSNAPEKHGASHDENFVVLFPVCNVSRKIVVEANVSSGENVSMVKKYVFNSTEYSSEGYRRMVSKMAWNVWRKLPPQTRVWLQVEDLIEDGMEWVVTVGIPKYRRDEASLCTFLYVGVGNYFKSEYLMKAYQRSRYEGRTVSLDSLDLIGVDDMRHPLESRVEALVDRKSQVDMIRGCWVVPMMVRIFKQATELLKQELRRWFLRVEKARIHTRQRLGRLTNRQLEFSLARHEFLSLARRERVEYDDCKHLLTNPFCQRELKFELAGL